MESMLIITLILSAHFISGLSMGIQINNTKKYKIKADNPLKHSISTLINSLKSFFSLP